MRRYAWKPGSVIKDTDAAVAGRILEAIYNRDGAVRPAALVIEATPADSPLHGCFEWRDDIAGRRWREEQARYLIRSITVRVTEAPQTQPIRAFVSIPGEDGGYMHITTAMSNAEMRYRIVTQALRELEVWHDRYVNLMEFAGIFAAIEKLKNKRTRKTRSSVRRASEKVT